MKLNVTTNDRPHRVEINEDATPLVALFDDVRYELTIHAYPSADQTSEQRAYLVSLANRVYECRVRQDAAGVMEISVGDKTFEVRASDPRELTSGGGAAGGAGGRARITAPMPGKVVRVMVETGAQVEAGDGLLVVEAMKMQNEMKAPKGGIVVELHAETNATVAAGDVLVVIE